MLSYVYDLGWARRERSLFFDLSVAHEDVTCQQRHGVIAAPSRPTYARGLLDSSLADLVSHEIVIGQVDRLAGSLSGHHVSGTPGITPPASPRREEGDFGSAWRSAAVDQPRSERDACETPETHRRSRPFRNARTDFA